MATRIKIRRDTLANWFSANPVLQLGELGFVTDQGFYYIGDGSTAFNSFTSAHRFIPEGQIQIPRLIHYKFQHHTISFTFPANQTYYMGYHPLAIGIGSENDHYLTANQNMALRKVGLFANRPTGGAIPSCTEPMEVNLHVDHTDDFLITNSWLHNKANNNMVVKNLDIRVDEGQDFSLKVSSPVSYGGTMTNQTFAYHLEFEEIL